MKTAILAVATWLTASMAHAVPVLDAPLPDQSESPGRALPLVVNLDDYFSAAGPITYSVVNSNETVVGALK